MRKVTLLTCLALASPGLLVGCGAEDGSAFTMLTAPGSLNSTADAEGYREGEIGYQSGEKDGSPDLAIQVELDDGGGRTGESGDGGEVAEDGSSSTSGAGGTPDGGTPDGGTPDGGLAADEGAAGGAPDGGASDEGGSETPVEVTYSDGDEAPGASGSSGAGTSDGPSLLGSCGSSSSDGDISVSDSSLWAPNNKMVPVSVVGSASSACFITDITDNESNLYEDSVITGDLTAELRATREGANLEGRIYTIALECSSDEGGVTNPTLEVRVCHDRRRSNR